MRLIPTEIEGIGRRRRLSKNHKLIEEFHASDFNCVKVEGWTHKDAKSCAGCLRQAAVRLKLLHIYSFVRNGEVYLVKEEI